MINNFPSLCLILLGGFLASIASGIVGSFVTIRKIEYISGSIAHTVLAGIGISIFFGKNPIVGAIIASIFAALIIGFVSLKTKKQEGSTITILWAIGMSIGLVFISKVPNSSGDLMGFLLGNISSLSLSDIYLLIVLNAVIVTLIFFFYEKLVAICFDEEFAKVKGIHVNIYFLLLLSLVAITVVSLIHIVGLVLVLALLTIPPVIAKQYVNTVSKIIFLSVILGFIFIETGLYFSYKINLPSGAFIVLLSGIIFLVSSLLRLKKSN